MVSSSLVHISIHYSLHTILANSVIYIETSRTYARRLVGHRFLPYLNSMAVSRQIKSNQTHAITRGNNSCPPGPAIGEHHKKVQPGRQSVLIIIRYFQYRSSIAGKASPHIRLAAAKLDDQPFQVRQLIWLCHKTFHSDLGSATQSFISHICADS